jgi:hypothetical protein
MDCMDDLGVVDPTQIRRRDPEVGMPELSLYDEQQDPLPGHLDSVRMPELMRGKPATNPGGPGALRN